MNTSNDDPNAQEFAEVLAGLGGLAERVDRARYPGRAWAPQPKGGRLRHPLAWAAAAAALAAVVVLAVYGPGWWSSLRGPADPEVPPVVRGRDKTAPPRMAATDQAEDPYAEWRIPWSMDPSRVGRLEFDVSSLPIPSIDKATGFDWQIPSLSFPVPEERNTNDDTQQDSDTGGGGRSGRSGRLHDDGPAAGAAPVS